MERNKNNYTGLIMFHDLINYKLKKFSELLIAKRTYMCNKYVELPGISINKKSQYLLE